MAPYADIVLVLLLTMHDILTKYTLREFYSMSKPTDFLHRLIEQTEQCHKLNKIKLSASDNYAQYRSTKNWLIRWDIKLSDCVSQDNKNNTKILDESNSPPNAVR